MTSNGLQAWPWPYSRECLVKLQGAGSALTRRRLPFATTQIRQPTPKYHPFSSHTSQGTLGLESSLWQPLFPCDALADVPSLQEKHTSHHQPAAR